MARLILLVWGRSPQLQVDESPKSRSYHAMMSHCDLEMGDAGALQTGGASLPRYSIKVDGGYFMIYLHDIYFVYIFIYRC